MKYGKIKVYFSLLFLTFFWGGSFIAAKIALNESISPTVLASLRFLVTLICFIPIMLLQKKKELLKSYSPLWLTFYTVLVGTATLILISIFDSTWNLVTKLSWSAWGSIFYLAIIYNGILHKERLTKLQFLFILNLYILLIFSFFFINFIPQAYAWGFK